MIPAPSVVVEGEWYTIHCYVCGHEARFYKSFTVGTDDKYCEHLNDYWKKAGFK